MNTDWWLALVELESTGNCEALRYLSTRTSAWVEDYSAAYNRASRKDPTIHALEVMEHRLSEEALRKLSALHAEPAAIPDPKTLTKYDLAAWLAYAKALRNSSLKAWARTCQKGGSRRGGLGGPSQPEQGPLHPEVRK